MSIGVGGTVDMDFDTAIDKFTDESQKESCGTVSKHRRCRVDEETAGS
jgi:hypothetical protein